MRLLSVEDDVEEKLGFFEGLAHFLHQFCTSLLGKRRSSLSTDFLASHGFSGQDQLGSLFSSRMHQIYQECARRKASSDGQSEGSQHCLLSHHFGQFEDTNVRIGNSGSALPSTRWS